MVVLFSHIFHSHSTKYIANKLNISNKTVYSHIYHAMEKNLLCRYSVKYLCYLQNNIKKHPLNVMVNWTREKSG
ncbi:LuxR C-terminal-related transcriptional regulator [Escherichia coli]|nr:LuxR C-terminal-related transcriptional regulator [Escherichia coli]